MDTVALSELIKTVCRNRECVQIDTYGKCFTEETREIIVRNVIKNIMCFHSKVSNDKIIDLAKNEIIWHESNLNRDILALKAEYGQ